MGDSHIVQLFHQLDEVIDRIIHENGALYLDCLADILQYIHLGEMETIKVDDSLTDFRVHLLNEKYSKQEIHSAIKLDLVKGMKYGTDKNKRITTQAVTLFINYI